ncbi:MAG: RNA methyltransferase [Blautia sp.]|nr:RNA methyltransferase [Blautia sp.]
MITSESNPQVKRVMQLCQKAKKRQEEGVFIAEGIKMFMEAPVNLVEKVYVSESAAGNDLVQGKITAEGLSDEIVSDRIFARMSSTQTPQGVLTVVKKPDFSAAQILDKKDPLIIVLEDLQDPGNAGTIIRTAEGAGADGVFLTHGSVDITNPKVIRATMGSVYRVPVVYVRTLSELLVKMKQKGIRSYAAHLKGSCDYDRADFSGGTAFLIGNEGNGLSDEAAGMADTLIRIPMQGSVESLNAAMAAGILMYEAARQRRCM